MDVQWIAEILTILSPAAGLLYSLLTVVVLFAAYEFNRRLQIVDRRKEQATYRLFNQLRFLFLSLAIHSGTLVYQASTDPSFQTKCDICSLLRIVSYIGIGITATNIALSAIVRIGDR